MFRTKKTYDPYDLLPPYRQISAFFPREEEAQKGWLRIHVLLQVWRKVVGRPCTPAELSQLLYDPQKLLEALTPRMPRLLDLLAPFAPPEVSPILPTNLLHTLTALYHTSPYPDLGHLYQLIQSPKQLTQKGQVFTSRDAVEHAFSLLAGPLDGNILDLTCGAGDYLIVAYEVLRDQYLKKGVREQEAHSRILNQLYGMDIDPLAVAITRCRLAFHCPMSADLPEHVVTGNSYRIASHPHSKQQYQLIVGNPPWGGHICAEDKKWIRQVAHETGDAQLPFSNSFVYFVQTAVRLVAPEGQFSLLVPASLLNVQSYLPLRRWLLTEVRLDTLHYVPHLFQGRYAPALFLTGTKTQAEPAHRVTVLPTARGWSPWQPSVSPPAANKQIRQSTFAKLPGHIFNIHYDSEMDHLWAQMRDGSFNLHPRRNVDFVLGLITGNNKQHIATRPQADHSQPIYTASDVEPFRLHPPHLFIHYDKSKLKQSAPESKYRAPEKLLYRFISKELITAIDRSGSFTLNNTNFLLPIDLPVSLRTLSALLNSTLLNTHYMYHFFTGKVTAHHLCSLPLRVPSPEIGREIEQLVMQLETSRVAEESQRHNQQLQKWVYRLYELTPAQQQRVERMYQLLRQFPFI